MNKMFKLGSSIARRLGPSCNFRKSSSASVQNIVSSEKTTNVTGKRSDILPSERSSREPRKNLVAAVFASLSDSDDIQKPSNTTKNTGKLDIQYKNIDDELTEASDINSLLEAVNKYPLISRSHALKVVSILSDWSASNKVKLAEFEADPRFLKICRILSKHKTGNITDGVSSIDDLNVIFSVTGDDEAARLITSLTLPQMIKVMSALAQKKRRNTSILRGLSFNIAKQTQSIDLKKCSDLLFAMASLNFPDELLMDRICNDIREKLPNHVDRSSVVGSIATSLKLLKYKDESVLDLLCKWVVDNSSISRPQDLASVLIAVANLGYRSTNEEFFKKIVSDVCEMELRKPSMWLDVVWSLTILERVTIEQISSVLSSDFFEKLIRENADVPITFKKKLLHIESYVKLLNQEYKGPFVHKDLVDNIPLAYTKEKEFFVQSILDTFKNLVASGTFLKQYCDSRMGFLYDAECAFDEKCNPVPLSTTSTPNKNIIHVALMALDYHDLCKKDVGPTGPILLFQNLLEKKGFKVLLIPYTECSPQQKLVDRVKYLERRLKELVLGKPA